MNAQVYLDQRNAGMADENNERITLKDSNGNYPPTYYRTDECGNYLYIVYWWYYGYQRSCFFEEILFILLMMTVIGVSLVYKTMRMNI